MTQWTHKYGFSLETLPERIAVTQGASQFTIGIPLEISSNENRVAIVPHSVKPLVMQGDVYKRQALISSLKTGLSILKPRNSSYSLSLIHILCIRDSIYAITFMPFYVVVLILIAGFLLIRMGFKRITS